MSNLNRGEGVPLSANVDITINSLQETDVKIFTSANKPLLLKFSYSTKEEGRSDEKLMIMFKTGDDMR